MSNTIWTLICALIISLLFDKIEAALHCGSWICHGNGAYCCGDACCYYVWSFWWFWALWVTLFVFLISCGYAVRRRYARMRPEYIIVRSPDTGVYGSAPSYGAVAGTAGVNVVYTYPGTAPGMSTVGAPTQNPPAYTDQKPPGYTYH